MRFLYARGKASYTHFMGAVLGYRRGHFRRPWNGRDGRGCDVFEFDFGVLSDE